jgi:hypothetical protein
MLTKFLFVFESIISKAVGAHGSVVLCSSDKDVLKLILGLYVLSLVTTAVIQTIAVAWLVEFTFVLESSFLEYKQLWIDSGIGFERNS